MFPDKPAQRLPAKSRLFQEPLSRLLGRDAVLPGIPPCGDRAANRSVTCLHFRQSLVPSRGSTVLGFAQNPHSGRVRALAIGSSGHIQESAVILTFGTGCFLQGVGDVTGPSPPHTLSHLPSNQEGPFPTLGITPDTYPGVPPERHLPGTQDPGLTGSWPSLAESNLDSVGGEVCPAPIPRYARPRFVGGSSRTLLDQPWLPSPQLAGLRRPADGAIGAGRSTQKRGTPLEHALER